MNARNNRSTSRNRSSEISQQITETNEKKGFQNEMTSLKKNIEDLKGKARQKLKFPQECKQCHSQHQKLYLKKIPTTIQKTKKGYLEKLEIQSSKSK